MKYLVDVKGNENYSIIYTVYVNDDIFEIAADTKVSTEELAEFLECEVAEIVQVELRDYEG
jgi:hypothetical protein